MHFTLVAFTPTRTRNRTRSDSHTHARIHAHTPTRPHTFMCMSVFMYHIYQCILFGGCCHFALPLAVLNAFPMICWQITFSRSSQSCASPGLAFALATATAMAFLLLFRSLFAQSRAQNFPNSFPKQTCICVKRLSLRACVHVCVPV